MAIDPWFSLVKADMFHGYVGSPENSLHIVIKDLRSSVNFIELI